MINQNLCYLRPLTMINPNLGVKGEFAHYHTKYGHQIQWRLHSLVQPTRNLRDMGGSV